MAHPVKAPSRLAEHHIYLKQSRRLLATQTACELQPRVCNLAVPPLLSLLQVESCSRVLLELLAHHRRLTPLPSGRRVVGGAALTP